jgi:hypothetical protein
MKKVKLLWGYAPPVWSPVFVVSCSSGLCYDVGGAWVAFGVRTPLSVGTEMCLWVGGYLVQIMPTEVSLQRGVYIVLGQHTCALGVGVFRRVSVSTAATPSQEPGNITHKRAPFTYFGRETTFITNIQESWHKDYHASQQHTTETANAKTPNPWQVQQIRRIQTHITGLQQGVYRADGTQLHTEI